MWGGQWTGVHDFSFSCEAHARVEGGAIQIFQTSKGVIFPSRAELSCGAHDRGGGGGNSDFSSLQRCDTACSILTFQPPKLCS